MPRRRGALSHLTGGIYPTDSDETVHLYRGQGDPGVGGGCCEVCSQFINRGEIYTRQPELVRHHPEEEEMTNPTVAEQKRAAAKIRSEKQLMMYAARNVRACQLRATGKTIREIASMCTTVGESRLSRILSKGEAHWQMWLDRAIEAGIEQEDVPGATPEAEAVERIEMIDIRLIGPNPFQPRKKYAMGDVMELFGDIFDNGLRIPITIRPSVHDKVNPYELGWGQLRLEAFSYAAEREANGDMPRTSWWDTYYDRDTGVTSIPAIIREMDDSELRMGALSENLNRNRMSWADTIRALDDACENTDYSAAEVAAIAKMSPQQLSNQRRLLRLPDAILDMVDEGVLAWTSARELLVFATQDHVHQLELDYCVNRLTAKMRSETDGDGNRKRIDASSVRKMIANAIGHGENHKHWESLSDSIYARAIGTVAGSQHRKEEPVFDVEAYANALPEFVHNLPGPYDGWRLTWTCAVEHWADWQREAISSDAGHEFSIENNMLGELPDEFLDLLRTGKIDKDDMSNIVGGIMKHGEHIAPHQNILREIARGVNEYPEDTLDEHQLADVVGAAMENNGWRSIDVYDLEDGDYTAVEAQVPYGDFDVPIFDLEAFHKRNKGLRHHIATSSALYWVTCYTKEWDRWQAEALEAQERAETPSEASFDGSALDAPETERSAHFGPVATAFLDENADAVYLPTEILQMLEEGKLSDDFLWALLGFVDKNDEEIGGKPGGYYHHHKEHLLAIAERLEHLNKFKSPDKPMSNASAGGAVLTCLRAELHGYKFHSLDDRLTSFGFEAPAFNIEQFIAEQSPAVHAVPIGTGLVRVTCSTGKWQAAQKAAIELVKAQVARGSSQSDEQRQSAQLQDMSMADVPQEDEKPVFREVSNCLYGLEKAIYPHWHVEYPATRRIWMNQSKGFERYEDALAVLRSLDDSKKAMIVAHEREEVRA